MLPVMAVVVVLTVVVEGHCGSDGLSWGSGARTQRHQHYTLVHTGASLELIGWAS